MKLFKTCVLCIMGAVSVNTAFAQEPTIKISPKFEAYRDSLKQVKYDHVFPIWGQKAYSKGFDIPYPVGAMAILFGWSRR